MSPISGVHAPKYPPVIPAATSHWRKAQPFLSREYQMAHKKIERKKELDRRRHRREQRLKQRIHEAKAAKA